MRNVLCYWEVLDNPITSAHAQHSFTRYAAIKALLVVELNLIHYY